MCALLRCTLTKNSFLLTIIGISPMWTISMQNKNSWKSSEYLHSSRYATMRNCLSITYKITSTPSTTSQNGTSNHQGFLLITSIWRKVNINCPPGTIGSGCKISTWRGIRSFMKSSKNRPPFSLESNLNLYHL